MVAAYLSTGWSKLRCLLLDDPVQHIDDYRSLHLVELLASVSKDNRQIICTAEDAALADLFARRLRGVAPGPGALVEMEYQAERGVMVKTWTTMEAASDVAILSA